jgi:sigma-B regulation protein RsbU (phosphoserine phosphatase)
LDEFHFAMFLLDVSGHGVGAALLSVSAVNVLRSRTLPVDFLDPGRVVGAMNNAFQMEKQNNMFFTLWYGVFDRRNRELRFANAGHPPAVLFPPSADGAGPARLTAPGMIAGCFPSQGYAALSVEIPPGSRLYLFSDGAYEIPGPGGEIWGLEAFIQQLRLAQPEPGGRVDLVFSHVCDRRGTEELQDDVCILEVTLP